MIIAISGKINSGKDTVGKIANIILSAPHFTDEAVESLLPKEVFNQKYEIKKFADKLKDIVCLLIGCTREQLEDREFKEKELGEEWWYYKDKQNYSITVYNDFTDHNYEIMYHLIKLTPRTLLQLLGTECGRRIIHPNIWVNSLMNEYKSIDCKCNGPGFCGNPGNCEELAIYPNWIITDMRFPNELKAVKDKGGITIRVNRDYILTGGPEDPKDQHKSETLLDNAEFDHVISNNGSMLELIQKIREILIKEKFLEDGK